jgi:hypothetical protein
MLKSRRHATQAAGRLMERSAESQIIVVELYYCSVGVSSPPAIEGGFRCRRRHPHDSGDDERWGAASVVRVKQWQRRRQKRRNRGSESGRAPRMSLFRWWAWGTDVVDQRDRLVEQVLPANRAAWFVLSCRVQAPCAENCHHCELYVEAARLACRLTNSRDTARTGSLPTRAVRSTAGPAEGPSSG